MNRFFSYIDWPAGYSRKNFRLDLLAGLTVALVLIPQSMAYAELAGLPPYYGLYASFLPPIIASLFGSSRQLATGPVAVVSLLTATTLEPLATAGSQQYITYAILLALLVGAFQFSLGVFKLGLVVNFISHPVVNGFTNAAALIIASSQLPKLFGVHVDKAPHHYETIYRIIKSAWHYTHWPTLFMAILAFVIMYGLKRVAPRVPNVLAAVAATTVLSWAFGFEHSGLKIDKDAMRSLLEMGPYQYQKERDLDLYIERQDDGQSSILVLDNELPIYNTTVEDVVLRKSPYTKEMLNIRNIIKILKDSDVKLSRKEASVKIVQEKCIARLDLTYDESDIVAMAKEGSDSLENGYADGILESLALFSELLRYQSPPKAFRIPHHEIFGTVVEKAGGEIMYGPVVALSRTDNSLRLVENQSSNMDKTKVEFFQKMIQGKEKATVEGTEVFRYLKEAVLKQPSD